MKLKNKGFTLIELMIVIAIVGILMTYAIPAYQAFVIRSKAGECVSISNGAKVAISERWSATNDLTALTSNAAALLPAANTITGQNVDSVEVTGGPNGGQITCTFGTTASGVTADPALTGNTIILTPSEVVGGGSLTWVCTNTGLAAAHTPGDC